MLTNLPENLAFLEVDGAKSCFSAVLGSVVNHEHKVEVKTWATPGTQTVNQYGTIVAQSGPQTHTSRSERGTLWVRDKTGLDVAIPYRGSQLRALVGHRVAALFCNGEFVALTNEDTRYSQWLGELFSATGAKMRFSDFFMPQATTLLGLLLAVWLRFNLSGKIGAVHSRFDADAIFEDLIWLAILYFIPVLILNKWITKKRAGMVSARAAQIFSYLHQVLQRSMPLLPNRSIGNTNQRSPAAPAWMKILLVLCGIIVCFDLAAYLALGPHLIAPVWGSFVICGLAFCVLMMKVASGKKVSEAIVALLIVVGFIATGRSDMLVNRLYRLSHGVVWPLLILIVAFYVFQQRRSART